MSARRSAVFASLTLAATTVAPLAVAPSAVAAACGTVLSATKNGAPLPTTFIQATCSPGGRGESSDVLWSVWSGAWESAEGSLELGPAARNDTYAVTLDTGSIVPRVTGTTGGNVVVTRTKAGDGHWHVTISAKPVLSTQGCSQAAVPWTCPEVAESQREGYLGGNITDYGSWEDTAQREAFFGMDYASNIDAGSIPPDVVKDPDSGAQMIRLELANSHFLKSPSTTVFRGNASVLIPNNFLKLVYEIDDPGSLTTGGLKPLVTGKGSGSVNVVDTGSALRVDVTNLTFSQRNVNVRRGNIKPAKVTRLAADRTAAGKVKLTYNRAKARGSKVKGYTISCSAKSGPKHAVTVNDKRPATTLTGLKANTAYLCKVRARSAAGNGGWAKVQVSKKP